MGGKLDFVSSCFTCPNIRLKSQNVLWILGSDKILSRSVLFISTIIYMGLNDSYSFWVLVRFRVFLAISAL